MEKIRKSDHDVVRLLNYEVGPLYRDWEAKNSILLTWQISFDHIQGTRPSAAGLLSLMSFFDRQGIPEKLLRVECKRNNDYSNPEQPVNGSSEENTDSTSESDTDHDFEDDITTLRDYSFISVGEDRSVFTMHRLVQLTARVWLKTRGQMEHCI